MITNLLKFRDYSGISFSHDLINNLTICNSRNFIFINSIISAIRELLIYKSTIALSLNNKHVLNVDDVIFNFFT